MNKLGASFIVLSLVATPLFGKDDSSTKSFGQVISDLNTLNELIATQPLVVVKIGAPWCTGCKQVTRALQDCAPSTITLQESLEKYSYQQVIHFVDIRYGSAPTITSHYNIKSIPRLLFYVNGSLFKDLTGSLSRKELIDIFNEMIQALPNPPQP